MYEVLAALGGSSFERAMSTMENNRCTHSASNKGQLRNTRPKASGAAQLKRNAKTRNNINKRKGK